MSQQFYPGRRRYVYPLLIGLGSRWVVFADSDDLGRMASIVVPLVITDALLAFEIWRLTLGAPDRNLDRVYFTSHWMVLAILPFGAPVSLRSFAAISHQHDPLDGILPGQTISPFPF